LQLLANQVRELNVKLYDLEVKTQYTDIKSLTGGKEFAQAQENNKMLVKVLEEQREWYIQKFDELYEQETGPTGVAV